MPQFYGTMNYTYTIQFHLSGSNDMHPRPMRESLSDENPKLADIPCTNLTALALPFILH